MKTKLSNIIFLLAFVYVVLVIVFGPEVYPKEPTGKLANIIPTIQYLDHFNNRVSMPSILALIIVYFGFCRLHAKDPADDKELIFKIHAYLFYFLLIFNMLLSTSGVVFSVIGFCSFESYTSIQLIFPPPIVDIGWLVIVVYLFFKERYYLICIMKS